MIQSLFKRIPNVSLSVNRTKVFFCMIFCVFTGTAWLLSGGEEAIDNSKILEDYVKSKGTAAIVFDGNNIKQFWIDSSVVARNNAIDIMLNANRKESVPLKLQFVNVNETMDCKIDVITEKHDISFYVTDSKSKKISSSASEDDFVQYHIVSSVLHMEDIKNDSFNLVFKSEESDVLSIDKIVLSFTQNPNSSFLASRTIRISEKDLTASPDVIKSNEDGSFILKGTADLNKKIIVSDNTFATSVKVKNISKGNTWLHVGFKIFSRNGTQLQAWHYPFSKDNGILKVVSSNADSKSIIVDCYPEWENKCFLALNAKEDMSDIPSLSNNYAGIISEVKKLDNGNAEIILNSALKQGLKEGTPLRVHGYKGGYICPISILLKPEEEMELSSTIKKNETSCSFSPDAFPKGVYYVIPSITTTNNIAIYDYSISY